MDNKPTPRILDAVRGSLIGGAAGDALGYAVEFVREDYIFNKYGKNGITEYELDPHTGKAIFSDDTQMTLFTAVGLLHGQTRARLRGIAGPPASYVAMAYNDWLTTQISSFEQVRKARENGSFGYVVSWLLDEPALFERRAPGNTCLSALMAARQAGSINEADYIAIKRNHSKGCGGVMRTAPCALFAPHLGWDIDLVDMQSVQAAAITHGHSLGYMPSAVLSHIIFRLIAPDTAGMPLKTAVLDAIEALKRLFSGDENTDTLAELIGLAVSLSENSESDLDNIHALGEGWVGEDALAIAIYCALRYENDFSAGIIAAANHNGDSDSTAAICGNILGAKLRYSAIEEKWKRELEMHDLILEIADDLAQGCLMSEYDPYTDEKWVQKYVKARACPRR
ncbi:MAG: ADP-ribosylglycohydrolase family protein [Clostridia bacterium]|nr:ADP-ribosylglycohydrolase family protein [Clostridia bacterium]